MARPRAASSFELVYLGKIVGLALLLALTSCSQKKATDGKLLLRGAGASFPNPLYQKWSDEFGKQQNGVEVEYKSVGSGKGIDWFLEESIDFGASDRAMSDEQIASAKKGALLVPTSAGMVVLAYNSDGLPANLRLSRDVYVDIFLGKIKHWNDPRIKATNPAFMFPDEQITVVVRQDKSGTTFAFTNHLAAVSPEWKQGPGVGQSVQWRCSPLPAPGNEGVVALIKRTPYSIGYAEYGQTRRLGLCMAELQNQAKQFISPALASAQKTLSGLTVPENFRAFMPDPAGDSSYPIITYTWILAHKRYDDAKKAEALVQFLTWCLKDGQAYCEELGYVRLPPDLAQRVIEEVHRIR
jgi:phosphate transport system substrate-binding protein